jgi:hypothetical protein
LALLFLLFTVLERWANVGYWPSLNRSGTSVNATSADKHCGMGQAGTYNDNLVEVARVA